MVTIPFVYRSLIKEWQAALETLGDAQMTERNRQLLLDYGTHPICILTRKTLRLMHARANDDYKSFQDYYKQSLVDKAFMSIAQALAAGFPVEKRKDRILMQIDYAALRTALTLSSTGILGLPLAIIGALGNIALGFEDLLSCEIDIHFYERTEVLEQVKSAYIDRGLHADFSRDDAHFDVDAVALELCYRNHVAQEVMFRLNHPTISKIFPVFVYKDLIFRLFGYSCIEHVKFICDFNGRFPGTDHDLDFVTVTGNSLRVTYDRLNDIIIEDGVDSRISTSLPRSRPVLDGTHLNDGTVVETSTHELGNEYVNVDAQDFIVGEGEAAHVETKKFHRIERVAKNFFRDSDLVYDNFNSALASRKSASVNGRIMFFPFCDISNNVNIPHFTSQIQVLRKTILELHQGCDVNRTVPQNYSLISTKQNSSTLDFNPTSANFTCKLSLLAWYARNGINMEISKIECLKLDSAY